MIVFNNGINNGLRKILFLRGQFNPNSIDGANELCKKLINSKLTTVPYFNTVTDF